MWILILGTAAQALQPVWGYRFSLQVINEVVPENRRAEVVSSYLIACYCGISLPVIGIGIVSHASSTLVADALFAAATSTLAVLAFVVQPRISATR
jgi:hypothetical protein